MDEQDRSEARAVYRNARQGSQGKGDADNRISQADKDKAPIWCKCIFPRFKDKCKVCNEH
jgi:hypothetical protein